MTKLGSLLLARLGVIACCPLLFVPTLTGQTQTSGPTLAEVAYIDAPPIVVFGYGIVTGLNGDGDGCRLAHTDSTLAASYRRLAIERGAEEISVGCCAAVLVSAEIAPGQRPGTWLDVTAVALGDARRISGGVLQPTKLHSHGMRHSITASGTVSTGNMDTDGLAPVSGAICEAGVVDFASFVSTAPAQELNIITRDLDGHALCELVERINRRFGEIAVPAASNRITICLPDAYVSEDDRLLLALELGSMPVSDPAPHWFAGDEPFSGEASEPPVLEMSR